MKKLFLLISLLCSLSLFGQQDIPIVMRGNVIDLFRNIAWNSSGIGGFNNNYVIGLPTTDQGICFSLTNLDSSSHTFTVGASVTADPRLTSFTGNSAAWTPVANVSNSTTRIILPNSATYNQFFKYSGAVRLVISLGGGSSTGNVTAFLTLSSQGGCATTPYVSVVAQSEFSSSALTNGRAYAASACVTNPGANANIVTVLWTSTNAGVSRNFYHMAKMSTSAAGQMNISTVSAAGTTCSSPGAVQSPITGANTSTSTVQSACTVVPTVALEVDDETLAAGIPTTFDLQGWWTSANSARGIEIRVPVAITGTVCGTIEWSELP